MADGDHLVSFYDAGEFDGALGLATVSVKDGHIVGLKDDYDFDWNYSNKRSTDAEWATRAASLIPLARGFNIYGGEKWRK